ncbi:MAG: hypothetical protein ACE5KO_06700 [Candidatus Bathyarchaeia archaeon]
MEKPKFSSNQQVAISVLAGLLLLSGIAFTFTLYLGPEGPFFAAAPIIASEMVFALIFLPLLWWRNKAGYIGAIGVGIFDLILFGVSGIRGIIVLSPEVVSPALVIVHIVLSVVLIVTSVTAGREKEKEKLSTTQIG